MQPPSESTPSGGASSASRPKAPVILARYDEIALKGRNRAYFEKALRRNLASRLKGCGVKNVERPWGRILVWLDEQADPDLVAERATDVFGITSVSPGICTSRDIPTLKEVARELTLKALATHRRGSKLRFRVTTKRADKSFPMTSPELSGEIGGTLAQEFSELSVDLANPDFTLGIEVRSDKAFVYGKVLKGPGGLPVGTLGHVMGLLSGGIDSPVAAYLAMKRGLKVSLVHFHSPPFIGEASKQKVIDLAEKISRFQPKTRLYVVPFADVQVAIKKSGDDSYRTLLYRRYMHRIAEYLGRRARAKGLLSGDCLGQVASQTLENLAVLDDSCGLPLLRPLLTFDKTETIALAKKIGTYDISIQAHPDCCTVFQPQTPATRGRVQDVRQVEEKLEVDELCYNAARQAEIYNFSSEAPLLAQL